MLSGGLPPDRIRSNKIFSRPQRFLSGPPGPRPSPRAGRRACRGVDADPAKSGIRVWSRLVIAEFRIMEYHAIIIHKRFLNTNASTNAAHDARDLTNDDSFCARARARSTTL